MRRCFLPEAGADGWVLVRVRGGWGGGFVGGGRWGLGADVRSARWLKSLFDKGFRFFDEGLASFLWR
jgi:hypothetical protein